MITAIAEKKIDHLTTAVTADFSDVGKANDAFRLDCFPILATAPASPP